MWKKLMESELAGTIIFTAVVAAMFLAVLLKLAG